VAPAEPATPAIEHAENVRVVSGKDLRRRKDLPETVWVETYLMGRASTPNDLALVDGMDSPGTRLAMALPLFQASHRPSSIAYSALKERREGGSLAPTWTTNAAAQTALDAPKIDTKVTAPTEVVANPIPERR
jgi:hypothetical protein